MNHLIRFARKEHLTSIMDAEKRCFSHDPWGESTVLSLIEDENTGFVLWHTVDAPNTVAAYLVYCKTDPVELYKIAVLPEHRKKGLGTKIMQHLIRIASNTVEKRIILEVRESNAPARRLYERLGFKTDGVRKNYYKNPTENGILMSLDLTERQ